MEYNSLMNSSEQSDFYFIKRRKIMSDAVYSSPKGRNELYLGYFGRNFEKLSLDIMIEYNPLMFSSEQSDFYNIKRRKIMSDAGNSSSEGSIETIFR
jgi:hypothetical protein